MPARASFPPSPAFVFRWDLGGGRAEGLPAALAGGGERVEGGGPCRHLVSLPRRLARGAGHLAFAVASRDMGSARNAAGGLDTGDTGGNARPGARLPLAPGRELGPLCRSAASGHSARARALLAPPLPRGANPSRRAVALLFVAIPSAGGSAAASGLGLAAGPSGRGGAAWFPPRWPRGRGRRPGIGAVRPPNGLREPSRGLVNGRGTGPAGSAPSFRFLTGEPKGAAARGTPSRGPRPFPAGQRLASWPETGRSAGRAAVAETPRSPGGQRRGGGAFGRRARDWGPVGRPSPAAVDPLARGSGRVPPSLALR